MQLGACPSRPQGVRYIVVRLQEITSSNASIINLGGARFGPT